MSIDDFLDDLQGQPPGDVVLGLGRLIHAPDFADVG